MLTTLAAITKLAISPHWQAFKIVLAGGSRIGTKKLHYLLPFLPMRANIPESIDHVSDVMGHFVRYGLGQVVVEVPVKNKGIVANDPLTIAHTVHSRCPATKVKKHGNFNKISRK